MEITWFGGSCVRLKGREGVVVADPFRSIVGPTGRGMTADIVSFGYPEESSVDGHGGRAQAELSSRFLGVPVPASLSLGLRPRRPG